MGLSEVDRQKKTFYDGGIVENSLYHRRLRGLACLIGNTPLLEIHYAFAGKKRVLYAKAENLNMTGSIKDRMAFYILKHAYLKGDLKPGDTIAEATSGNTGISFAALGRALGHKVTIFMPDWMSEERMNLIRSLGADIHTVSREEGGFLESIQKARNMAAENPGVFLPSQFQNNHNISAHRQTTGPEIWWQLRFHGRTPDAFLAGVGTGGTVMGVGQFLRQKKPEVKIHPLEPKNSPTLSTGCKVGKHRIQGISDEFIPPILNLPDLDEIIAADDGDAIKMAQMFARDLGLGVGISSGANFIGAVEVQNRMGDEAVVVTVFPDDNKKYLTTDLLKEEPEKRSFLSTHIRLLSYRGLKRVCYTCCDPEECLEDSLHPQQFDIPLPPCPRRS